MVSRVSEVVLIRSAVASMSATEAFMASATPSSTMMSSWTSWLTMAGVVRRAAIATLACAYSAGA